LDHRDWVEGGREAGETSAQVLRNSKWEFVVKVSEAVQEGQDEEETRRGGIRVTEEDPDSPSTVVGQVHRVFDSHFKEQDDGKV
jgi:hypothetical protein